MSRDTFDSHGREYLTLEDARVGMMVELDDGMTCSRGKVELKDDPMGQGVYFDCDNGKHFIIAHYDGDNECFIGLYPVAS